MTTPRFIRINANFPTHIDLAHVNEWYERDGALYLNTGIGHRITDPAEIARVRALLEAMTEPVEPVVPEPEPEPKFKVGDRVKYTGSSKYTRSWLLGKLGTVKAVLRPTNVDVSWDGGDQCTGVFPESLELIPDPPALKFKVGDRVVFGGYDDPKYHGEIVAIRSDRTAQVRYDSGGGSDAEGIPQLISDLSPEPADYKRPLRFQVGDWVRWDTSNGCADWGIGQITEVRDDFAPYYIKSWSLRDDNSGGWHTGNNWLPADPPSATTPTDAERLAQIVEFCENPSTSGQCFTCRREILKIAGVEK